MVKDLQSLLSTNIKGMKRSAIRELLKLVNRPEIISFAGGLPSPEAFPIKDLQTITSEVMANEATMALQYGATEGDPLLREQLVARYNKMGFNITVDNIIITTASQQALDLLAKAFIDRGDEIIVELPSYLGALSAFNSYGAVPHGIPMDENGMRADLMEDCLKEMASRGKKPKFVYIIPDFQNPAGSTMKESRRVEILELVHKYDLILIEDSPYRELRYEGKDQKTLYELDGGKGNVILLGTFSKIFAPGFRIGWVVAHPEINDKIVVGKQATDLCTPPFTQRITARYLEKNLLDDSIVRINALYKEKKSIMLKALDDYMPEDTSWTKPEGGLFLQLTCPPQIDTNDLLVKAIKDENVAFVAGHSFYCDGSGTNTMRLNFSFADTQLNAEGIRRLANVIKKELS